MIRYQCDKCGRSILAGDTDHYIVRIEAFASEVSLEITEDDLQKDHTEEIRRTIERLSSMPLDAVEDPVYRSFRYDLCRECHRAYLKNPLNGGKTM